MSQKDKGILYELWEVFKIFLMAMVLAIIIVQFVRPTRVEGLSMYPTLDNNDYLIVNRLSRYTGFKRGQIVVFDSNLPTGAAASSRNPLRKALDFVLQDDSSTKDLVKRIIAVGGDHLVIDNGIVTVNGKRLKEDYVSKGNFTEGKIDVIVPKGELFCMGDNRMRSLDSRYPEVGFVPENKVIGTIMIRLLPADKFGIVH